MKIWTVSNQKGGVGKTTTAITLAGLLSKQGKRVLCVDIDPQGSMTSYFRLNPDNIKLSAYNLFKDSAEKRALEPKKYIQSTSFPKLDLLPAATALATLDRQASQFKGLGLVISNTLQQLQSCYDFVIIDSPPMLGVLMINALAACDHLIVPVQTEFLAIKGLERMTKTLSMIQRTRQSPLDYTILPTMFDKRTRASTTSLNALRNQYPNVVWEGYIPVDTQLREASRVGIPASILAPSSKSVVSYNELLKNLLDKKVKLRLVSNDG